MLLIILESYEKAKVEEALELLFSEALIRGVSLSGPIPFPTRIKRFTVLRSPHIDKKSREQFEMRRTRRGLKLLDVSSEVQIWLKTLVKRLPCELAIKIRSQQSPVLVEK